MKNFTEGVERTLLSPTTTLQPETRIETESLLLLIGYGLVFCIGTAGNGTILYLFRHYWRRGPIIELSMLYLAVFNLLSSMIDPFVFGYWILTGNKSWHFGWLGCKILPYLCRIFTDISIGLILIMAVDRCRAIVFPLRRRMRRNTVHILVVVTVVLGSASEIHHINALYIRDGKCKAMDVTEPIYSYPLIIIVSSRMLIIIFVLFCTTLAAYLKLENMKREKLLQGTHEISTSLSNRCKKVTMMLVVMATVFAVSVLPRDFFHLVYVISWSDKDGIIMSDAVMFVNKALKLLQTSNVIYNVFIYARMHETFRKRKGPISFCMQPQLKMFTRSKNHIIHRSPVPVRV